jgi:hypothetical protein
LIASSSNERSADPDLHQRSFGPTYDSTLYCARENQMKRDDYLDPEIEREMRAVANVFIEAREKEARKKRTRAFRYANPLRLKKYKAPKRLR